MAPFSPASARVRQASADDGYPAFQCVSGEGSRDSFYSPYASRTDSTFSDADVTDTTTSATSGHGVGGLPNWPGEADNDSYWSALQLASHNLVAQAGAAEARWRWILRRNAAQQVRQNPSSPTRESLTAKRELHTLREEDKRLTLSERDYELWPARQRDILQRLKVFAESLDELEEEDWIDSVCTEIETLEAIKFPGVNNAAAAAAHVNGGMTTGKTPMNETITCPFLQAS